MSDLTTGYYRLTVRDSLGTVVFSEITLTEPAQLSFRLLPSEYPNGFNISCNECYNGSIALTVTGGLAPYSFLWQDGSTLQNRSNIGSVTYSVEITDANGCEAQSNSVFLTQPERDGWYRSGNQGTDPAQHYLGTSDSSDLVLRTNGQEILRLKGSGEIELPSSVGSGLLYRDENGTLRGGGGIIPGFDYNAIAGTLCGSLGAFAAGGPFWKVGGNNFDLLCPGEAPVLGTLSSTDLHLIANGLTHMVITPDGRIGIGTEDLPGGAIVDYRLYVEDGIVTREVLVQTGPWPDYVFEAGYELMPLSELREHLVEKKHLPGIPSAVEIEKANGVAIGDLQARMLKVVEEQTLYILQLEERIKRLEEGN